MRVDLEPSSARSTTRLGDWYAADLVLSRRQFILAVNSASRLAVVLAAAPYASFQYRLPDAVAAALDAMGVKKDAIEGEIQEMRDVVLSKTANRSIIGTLNDYRKNMEFMASIDRLKIDDLLGLSLKMSGTPSLVMPGTWPQDVTLRLFGQERSKPMVVAQPGPRLVLVK